MARIGFAFNLKPDAPSAGGDAGSDAHLAHATPHPNGSGAPREIQSALAAEASIDDEYAEWDAPETIDAVERALSAIGDVVRLEANDDFPERVRRARPDIVFNMAEGWRGPNREAHIPAILEFLGIPYSGSDPFTLSACLDKARTKELLSYYDVPTPSFARITNLEALEPLRRWAFPLFVKPIHEGSSKGITTANCCRDFDELVERATELLEHYHEPVLVETYLPGDEFTCGVLGNGADAVVLPVVRLRFEALPPGVLPIFGFEAKWIWDTHDHPLEMFECPARVDDGLLEHIERTVLRTYRVLGCRDWARIDIRLDDGGVPNVVEVNPLPGIMPDPADNSCLPLAARMAGMGYDELIQRCLMAAAAREQVALPRAPAFARLPRRSPANGVVTR
jgi:D-alanine-D-alanine ligase